MKTPNERLADIRQKLGYQRKADFAEAVGIERSAYDKLEKGPHKPSADNLAKIVGRFPEVDLNWLLLGIGEMLRERPTPAPTSPDTEPQGPPPTRPAANGVLYVNTEGETLEGWKMLALDRLREVEFYKELLRMQFGMPTPATDAPPAAAGARSKTEGSENAAARRIGFPVGPQPAPQAHRLAWVDAALAGASLSLRASAGAHAGYPPMRVAQ